MSATIDWLAFRYVVPEGESPEWVAHEVAKSFGSFELLPFARFGYTGGVQVLGTGVVYWSNERPDMGVYVSLPSSALALLNTPPRQFVGDVLAAGGTFSRIDVALDTDKVTVYQCRDMFDSGELVTPVQAGRWVEGVGGAAGATLYLGGSTGKRSARPSSSVRRLVRIYDKRAEQGLPADSPVWTRIEVQLMRSYAVEASYYIASGEPLERLIVSAVDFRERKGGDSNPGRWPRQAWWVELVSHLRKLRFGGPERVIASIKESLEWVAKQVAPTLAKLRLAFGHEMYLVDLLGSGEARLRGWQRAQARVFGDLGGHYSGGLQCSCAV